MKKHFKNLIFSSILMLILGIGGNVYALETVEVEFNDSNFCSTVLNYMNDGLVSSSDCTTEKTITFVNQEALDSVHNIDIHGVEVTDLTGIEKFTELTTLYLSSMSIDDISLLSNLTNLKYLLLDYNDITDISPLENLTSLEEIDIDSNGLSDLSPLAGLTNLTYLCAEDNEISDITPLADLTKLEYLYLDNNDITDISPLENLISLEEIELDENGFSDLSSLAGLTNLTYLCVEYNEISDITPLADLTKLKYLYLEGNEITNITPLKNLTSLVEMDLGYNYIKNIESLKNLNNLEYLYLGENNITNLISFEKMTKLEDLILSHNYIEDPEIVDVDNLSELTTYVISSQWYETYLEAGDTFELPNIFKLAKTTDGAYYTPIDFTLVGLEIDENFVITIDEEAQVGNVCSIEINGGIADGTIYLFRIVEDKTNSFENVDKTVSLESLKHSYDGSFTLIATDITSELEAEDKEELQKKLKDGELLALFEIHLEDGDDIIWVENGLLNIKIKMTEEMKKYENFKMAFVEENGEVNEVLEVKVEGDYLVFTTTHLSQYALQGNEIVANPKTGDIILISVSALIVGALGMFFAVKKLKSNK